MAIIDVDQSRFPLVTVTFESRIADHEFDQYLAAVSRVLQRRQKYAIVFDARRARPPTAMQRSKQTAWLKANRAMITEYSCGSVFVIASAIVRGALTAILWVSPIPAAYTVVATMADADRWALDRLRAEGVPLSSAR